MTRRATSARTTLGDQLLALDFREVHDATDHLEAALGVRGKAAVATRLADASFVEARLLSLSGGALATLEILAESGGAAVESTLCAALQRRLGISPADASRCLMLAEASGLALRVESSTMYTTKTIKKVALLSDCAGIVASRVRGVTLRNVEAPTDLAPAASHALRDLAARIASTVHGAIRVTSAGHANRTSLKKLAPRVGLAPEALGQVLDQAARSGVLGAREGLMVPLVDDLRALARGEIVIDPVERQVRQLLDSSRWTSVEWLERATSVATPGLTPGDLHEAVDGMPSVVVAEHAGVKFVRQAPVGTSGDGHVTPAFEVMLGPACDPEMAALLALAAEPVRFDRVITLKLGPASVAAACALGVSADEILGTLARVGRHAVPDNVRVMVLDWAQTVRRATVRKAWLVETSSADAADVAARALGSKVLARPTSTMILVDEEVASPGAALAKAGIVTGDRPERWNRFSEPMRVVVPDAKSPPTWTPMPALAARVEADRAKGTLVPAFVNAPHAPSPAESLRSLASGQAAGTNVRVFLDRVTKLWAAAEDDYADWADSLEEVDGDLAKMIAVETPLRLLPFVTRAPKERARLLQLTDDVAALVRAAEGRDPSGLTLDGAFVVSMLNEHRDVDAFVMGEIVRGMKRIGIDPGPKPAPKTRAAPQPVPPSSNGRPRAIDVEEAAPAAIRRALDALVVAQGTAWLRVRSKSQGERVVRLRVERILVRGTEATVLGTDVDEELGRSFPIANVVGIRT